MLFHAPRYSPAKAINLLGIAVHLFMFWPCLLDLIQELCANILGKNIHLSLTVISVFLCALFRRDYFISFLLKIPECFKTIILESCDHTANPYWLGTIEVGHV